MFTSDKVTFLKYVHVQSFEESIPLKKFSIYCCTTNQVYGICFAQKTGEIRLHTRFSLNFYIVLLRWLTYFSEWQKLNHINFTIHYSGNTTQIINENNFRFRNYCRSNFRMRKSEFVWFALETEIQVYLYPPMQKWQKKK